MSEHYSVCLKLPPSLWSMVFIPYEAFPKVSFLRNQCFTTLLPTRALRKRFLLPRIITVLSSQLQSEALTLVTSDNLTSEYHKRLIITLFLSVRIQLSRISNCSFDIVGNIFSAFVEATPYQQDCSEAGQCYIATYKGFYASIIVMFGIPTG